MVSLTIKLILILLSIPVRGTVCTPDGNGIRGVVVSDGYTCALTDCRGRYCLEADSLARTISVTVPSKYEIPLLPDGRPGIFRYIGSADTDFILERRKNRSDRFTLVAIADPHIKNDHALARFASESVPDVRRTMALHAAEGPVIGISLGDQLSDIMERSDDVKGLLQGFFYCIGNHDHNNAGGKSEYAVTDYYVHHFAPRDYSFDMGKVHFIVMDDIQYTGTQKDGVKISYTCGLDDAQLEWLRQDISLVKDIRHKAVVLCIHAPLFGRFTHKDEVKELLGRFSEAHVLSGHEHNINNVWVGDIWDHNIQSIGGAWWYSNLSPNGSPLGYIVMGFDGPAMAFEYNKATTESADFQMRVYSGDDSYGPDTPNPAEEDIKRRDKIYSWPDTLKGCFVARVWDGTRDWEVKFVQNGKETPMKMTETKFFDCATAAYMTDVHGAPFGGSGAYRPKVDSFWTIPAPCGDPSMEKDWEIVATHREPSGEVKTYRCSHLMQDFTGFATGSRYVQ